VAGQDREGGAFFANNRKQQQNHPDYRGELRLSQEVVRNLMEQMDQGVQFPAIELSGWKKTSNSGTVYISLSGKKPYVKDGAGQQGGGQRQAPQGGGQRQAPQGGWGGGQQGGWQPPASNDLGDDIPF
jgi:hypothetical protein